MSDEKTFGSGGGGSSDKGGGFADKAGGKEIWGGGDVGGKPGADQSGKPGYADTSASANQGSHQDYADTGGKPGSNDDQRAGKGQ